VPYHPPQRVSMGDHASTPLVGGDEAARTSRNARPNTRRADAQPGDRPRAS